MVGAKDDTFREMLGDAHMGETLQKWIEEWKSGRVTELPDWIPIDEADEWAEFERQHPELTAHDAEKLEQYKKLEETQRRSSIKVPRRVNATVSKALKSIRSASIRNGDIQFTSLFHHLNKQMLTNSFYELRKKASPGCDKVTWEEYA